MKITKFQHACFVATVNDRSVVVDPGSLSTDFVDPGNVVAIVVTHLHPDHLDESRVQEILANNPSAKLYAHQDVLNTVPNIKGIAVANGNTINIESFSLDFSGGNHAVIHPDIPVIANLGVLINNELYYPGDSFAKPDTQIKILALPIGAPWMKVAECMDYLAETHPEQAFPTHDALLSDAGKQITDRLVQMVAEKVGTTYSRL